MAATRLDNVGGGVFTRLGTAYGWDPDGIVSAAGRRTRKTLIVSASDGEELSAELGDDGHALVQCVVGGHLYAIASAAQTKLYRSADGENWSQVTTSGTDGGNFQEIFATSTGRLIAWILVGGDYLVYTSTDGAAWTAATLVGASEWAGTPESWNRHEHHGTIIVSTYNGVSTTNEIWRSVDDGLTWTLVKQLTSSKITHFHAVGYHPVLGKWIQDTGDNTGKQFNLISTDDGVTWVDWKTGSETPETVSFTGQTVRFIDYGHPTRLAIASDSHNRIGWADLDTYEAGCLLDIQTVDRATGQNFFFELFRHRSIWYATTQSDGTNGSRAACILVSPDLEHWAVYHRFPSTSYRSAKHFAGYIGGKLHFNGDDNGTREHFKISPAKAKLVDGVMIFPESSNRFKADRAKCEETASGVWSKDVTAAVLSNPTDVVYAGTKSIRYYYEGSTSGGLYSPNSNCPITVGQAYIGYAVVRGHCERVSFGIIGGTSKTFSLRPDGEWTEIWTVPFTATGTTGRVALTIFPQDGLADVYVGALGFFPLPVAGGWSPGYASSGGDADQPAENLAHLVEWPTDWTHVFTARLLPSTAELDQTDDPPAYLCSYGIDGEAGDYAEVYWDPADSKWKLMLTNDETPDTPVATAARWLQRGALVRMAVRYSAGQMRLSVCDGTTVEHTAAVAKTDALFEGVDGHIKTGDADGESAVPHILLDDSWLYDSCLSDDAVEVLLAGTADVGAAQRARPRGGTILLIPSRSRNQ